MGHKRESFFFTVGFVFLVSGVNLESGDAQEIGITYEMMQVCEGSLCFKSCLQVVKKMKVFENFFFLFFRPQPLQRLRKFGRIDER